MTDTVTIDPSSSQTKSHARRLVATANELLALARELEAHERCGRKQQASARSSARIEQPPHEAIARQIYRHRRRRRELFGSKLFGEPAWDILLDLFIAAKEGKRVSVTSACIAADVPSTTALRWIGLLEKEGLIIRENDEADARRVFIRLSADCHARMIEYLGGGVPARRCPKQR